MKTFVIGDIHGAYRALRQCMDRSGFDYKNDHLICLGDVCDGWPETKESIDDLLKIKNLTYLLGNHDFWALQWMLTDEAGNDWKNQGGIATIESYSGGHIPQNHINFLQEALPYYMKDNSLFVHAGIDPEYPLEQQDLTTFLWDRSLAQKALKCYSKNSNSKLSPFDAVFIGHTPIPFPKPIHSCGVWLMDTGAGWSGVLSLMDVDTKETFTSDAVPDLYPGIKGRTPSKS